MYDARIAKCLTAKRESRSVEFKEQFLPADAKQSLEILKDIVAIANSGGGTLVVGIRNSGEPSGVDVSLVLDHDHAKYCDLIRKYTLQDFCDFEVVEADIRTATLSQSFSLMLRTIRRCLNAWAPIRSTEGGNRRHSVRGLSSSGTVRKASRGRAPTLEDSCRIECARWRSNWSKV